MVRECQLFSPTMGSHNIRMKESNIRKRMDLQGSVWVVRTCNRELAVAFHKVHVHQKRVQSFDVAKVSVKCK